MSYLKKIILGSAQFSGIYGISNNKKLSFKEVDKIIKYSFRAGIREIEICSTYGNSQYKILKSIKKNKLIKKLGAIYKFNKIHKNTIKLFDNINEMTNLKIILSHSSKFYVSKKFQNFIKNLDNKKIKIGVSIYEIKELEKLLKYEVKPSIIQVPYNIFNQKFDQKYLIKKLNKHKIKIHVRSIFNQGLIFLSDRKFKSKFRENYKFFINFKKKLKKFDENLFSISLKLPLSKSYFKKILIGFSSIDHIDFLLKTKLKKINKELLKEIDDLKFYNSKISDPRKW